MNAMTFETIVGDDQVIRPPSGVTLPPGKWEVTVYPVETGKPALTVEEANAAVRNARVSRPAMLTVEEANAAIMKLRVAEGQPTGIDNESIDADLGRLYEADLPHLTQ